MNNSDESLDAIDIFKLLDIGGLSDSQVEQILNNVFEPILENFIRSALPKYLTAEELTDLAARKDDLSAFYDAFGKMLEKYPDLGSTFSLELREFKKNLISQRLESLHQNKTVSEAEYLNAKNLLTAQNYPAVYDLIMSKYADLKAVFVKEVN